MRDRVTELLPLLLAGLVLLIFQLSRNAQLPPFAPQPAATPTIGVEISPARPVVVRRPTPDPNAALSTISCDTAKPAFVGGMANLKAALGASMGDPLECEHPVNDRGDTHQQTSTGLAYYRRERNVACFTTGWDHWALGERGLVHWAGRAVDPPVDASVLQR